MQNRRFSGVTVWLPALARLNIRLQVNKALSCYSSRHSSRQVVIRSWRHWSQVAVRLAVRVAVGLAFGVAVGVAVGVAI